MKRDETMYWNMGDYDGMISCQEEMVEVQTEFANAVETRVD